MPNRTLTLDLHRIDGSALAGSAFKVALVDAGELLALDTEDDVVFPGSIDKVTDETGIITWSLPDSNDYFGQPRKYVLDIEGLNDIEFWLTEDTSVWDLLTGSFEPDGDDVPGQKGIVVSDAEPPFVVDGIVWISFALMQTRIRHNDEWVPIPGLSDGGGLTTVITAGPVSGDGSTSDPVTIADGAITAGKLASGVIPDVSGLATDAELQAVATAAGAAVSEESQLRVAADTALGSRIDGIDVPDPSDSLPVNTATAAAGTSADFARADHDHGITAGGGGLTSVATAAPVSGDGRAPGSAVTIADGAITAAKLASGVIPDVSGLATETALAAEETRATTAEGVNASGIAANAAAISAEETRATTAEGVNASGIAANAAAISAEETRATTAEGVNASGIAANAAAISAEETRATTAEGVNASGIAANASAISAHASGITANAVAINTNAAAISAEETRATGAEAALGTRVDTVTAAAATLRTDVGNEVAARVAADAALSARIDNIPAGGGAAVVSTDDTLDGDGSSGDPLSVAFPFTQQHLIDILGDIEDVVDYPSYVGDWAAGDYTAGQVVKASDGSYYLRLQDGTDTAEPTATTADWRQLPAGLRKTTAAFHEYLRTLGEMGGDSTSEYLDGLDGKAARKYLRVNAANDGYEFEEMLAIADWGSLGAGYTIPAGSFQSYNGDVYYCHTATTKGASGPDADTDHFILIDNHSGIYDTSHYYGQGATVTLSDGRIAFAKVDVAPSDPDPGDSSDTKWLIFSDTRDAAAGGEGSVNLVAVGTAVAVGAITPGPAIDDIPDHFLLEIMYTRTNSNLFMYTDVRKEEISSGRANVGTDGRVQLQGGGGAYVAIGTTADGNNIEYSNSGAGGYTSIVIQMYKEVAQGAPGPEGPPGDPGNDSVSANPAGTDGGTLTRIEIDGTNWNIGGSGSGGGPGAGTETELDTWARSEGPSANTDLSGTFDVEAGEVFAVGIKMSFAGASGFAGLGYRTPSVEIDSVAVPHLGVWRRAAIANAPRASNEIIAYFDAGGTTQTASGEAHGTFHATKSGTVTVMATATQVGGSGPAAFLDGAESTLFVIRAGAGETSVTRANVYAQDKLIWSGGPGVEIIAADAAEALRVDVTHPAAPVIPKYYGVASDDVRTTTAPYSQRYTFDSWEVPTSDGHASWLPVFTNETTGVPDGYEMGRPNMVYDGGDERFNYHTNPANIDFNPTSAGVQAGTNRRIKAWVELTVPPGGYTNADTITVRQVVHGNMRAVLRGTSNEQTPVVFHLNRANQQFRIDFDLIFTGAPVNTTDWWRPTFEASKHGLIVTGEFGYQLPFTGAKYPTQGIEQPGTSGHITIDNSLVPESVRHGYGTWLAAKWELDSPDVTGKNAPTEEDKADVSLGGTNSEFMVAAQDLRKVTITAHQGAAVSGPREPVYLCTYLPDVIDPTVLASAIVGTGSLWTMHWAGNAVEGQRFYMIVGGNRLIGDAKVTWDANFTAADPNHAVVVPGHLIEQRFRFSGSNTTAVTLAGLGDRMPQVRNVRLHAGGRFDTWSVRKFVNGERLVLDPYFSNEVHPYMVISKSSDDVVLSFRGADRNNGNDRTANIAVTLVDVDYEPAGW